MGSGYPGCLQLLSGCLRIEECTSLFVCAFRPSQRVSRGPFRRDLALTGFHPHEASHVVTIAETLFLGGRTPVARDIRKGNPVRSAFCTHCSPSRERNRMCI